MLKSSPLSSRGQFGQFLTDRGLTGLAVEVGTHRGEFADALLRTWPDGKCLYCVDPWACPPGYAPQVQYLWGGTQEEAMKHCRRHLTKCHRGRFELLRHTSEEALLGFTDGTLDFVYVDGDHRREHVERDLYGWWDKLKPGGVLAGHDFIQPGESHSWAAEVQTAVSEFAFVMKVDVHLIVEEAGLPWSYHMEKPK